MMSGMSDTPAPTVWASMSFTDIDAALALLTEAGETVTAQASVAGETFKARTEEAAERVVDLAGQTTRRAAAATRNGVSV